MEEVVVCAQGQCFVFVQSQLSKLKILTNFETTKSYRLCTSKNMKSRFQSVL